MEKHSYASAANNGHLHAEITPEFQPVTDNRPLEYMDVTALMNMLDKNRGQQPDEGGDTLVMEPKPEHKPSAEIRELPLDLPKQPVEVKAVPTADTKKAAARGASPKKKKKPAVKAAAEPAPAKDIPVPASVAVARLQVERNTQRHSRDMQVKTLRNSRRDSPVGESIAPVEYATVATLMAVAVAVLVAIFYLVNDKGEILPTATPPALNQTVVQEKAMPKQAAPQAPSQDAVERDLLNILNR